MQVLDEYVVKNEELKGQLKSSLDSMVEASAHYENKFNELHARVMRSYNQARLNYSCRTLR